MTKSTSADNQHTTLHAHDQSYENESKSEPQTIYHGPVAKLLNLSQSKRSYKVKPSRKREHKLKVKKVEEMESKKKKLLPIEWFQPRQDKDEATAEDEEVLVCPPAPKLKPISYDFSLARPEFPLL